MVVRKRFININLIVSKNYFEYAKNVAKSVFLLIEYLFIKMPCFDKNVKTILIL